MENGPVFVFDWESKSNYKMQRPLLSRQEFEHIKHIKGTTYKPDGESEKFALIGEHINGVLKVTQYSVDPTSYLFK